VPVRGRRTRRGRCGLSVGAPAAADACVTAMTEAWRRGPSHPRPALHREPLADAAEQ
jgi:hypothetical protein